MQQRLGTTERADRFYGDQVLDHLNDRMREFVARQEMFFLSTADRHGDCDATFPGRAGRVRPGAGRADAGVPGVPRQRRHGVHRQHLGEPAPGPADGRLHPRPHRAAHQRPGAGGDGRGDAGEPPRPAGRPGPRAAGPAVGDGRGSKRRTSTAPSTSRICRRSRRSSVGRGPGARTTTSARAATSSAPRRRLPSGHRSGVRSARTSTPGTRGTRRSVTRPRTAAHRPSALAALDRPAMTPLPMAPSASTLPSVLPSAHEASRAAPRGRTVSPRS